jgi:hypothetical protein
VLGFFDDALRPSHAKWRRRFQKNASSAVAPSPFFSLRQVLLNTKNQRINSHQSTDSDTLFQLTKLADAPLRAARNKATLVFAAERTPLRTAR